ncbi:alpha-amylase [Streptomyces sp. SID14478]|uniref:alpha-amylase n=1 Tax=Streptomyces sp. SID14478 TaxID=2706073 RepID=UPI0013DF2CAD|nr:alpha-amylase [Streptomyces sp. SID14478]NEB81883.1 alpha-amylase [Streptomyces sp. SID14478]
MKYRMRLAGGLVAASALLGSGFVTASAASAASAVSAVSAAPAASAQNTAPACVKRDVIKHRKYVKVTNNCSEAMHVKVVIDWGNDSPCLTYQPGEQWEWNWGRGSYGKVVTC